jgi:uncharacterized protein YjbI with pentapeptide repeats
MAEITFRRRGRGAEFSGAEFNGAEFNGAEFSGGNAVTTLPSL